MSPWSTAGPLLHRTTGTAHRFPSHTPVGLITDSLAAGVPASLIRVPIRPGLVRPGLARFGGGGNGQGVHRKHRPPPRGGQMSVFGGPDPGPEDELGGPDRGPEDELGTDAGPEDELGGADRGPENELGTDAGPEDELRTQD